MNTRKTEKKTVLIFLFNIVSLILFIVASYEYAVFYLAWKNLPAIYGFLVLSALCVGVTTFFMLDEYVTDCKKGKLILFSVLAGFLSAILSIGISFLVNNILYNGEANSLAINCSIGVSFGCFGTIQVLFWAKFGSKRVGKIVRSFVAGLVIVCTLGGFVLYGYRKEVKNLIFFEEDVTFNPINSSALQVSFEEKQLCKKWYEENIVYAGSNGKVPAYNFDFGKKNLRDTIADWSFIVGTESEVGAVYKGGKTTEITAKSEKYGLSLRVVATLYEENATCEWTVYLKNTASENSPEIKDFNAIETELSLGKADLYCSKGSDHNADDFTLMKAKTLNITLSVGATNGRPTAEYLPYFNLCGERYGCDLAVGWMGNWQSTFKQVKDDVKVTVQQSTLQAELTAGEEIRSPMVSLTFYKNSNPLKGFNSFRNFVKDCLYSDNLPSYDTVCDLINCSPTLTEEEITASIDAISEETWKDIYAFWIDAGWYCTGEGSIWDDRFGYWDTNEKRLPNGVRLYSNIEQENGVGLVLWYEPERQMVGSDSDLMTEALQHDDWLLHFDTDSKYVVWNYANKEAAEYISRYISDSLIENGVTVFRQDSNFELDKLWEYGDKNYYGGRNGITENHYITNHYAFLDYLFESNENLKLYDICASGGTRLELELIHRGVPLWRSDYNCFTEKSDLIEATQSQTYSVSFWLPYTGTSCYVENEYTLRSSIYQHIIMQVSDVQNTELMKEVSRYEDIRASMNKNYYPVSYAEHDDYENILAMQYGDEESGYLLIYKREEVKDTSFSCALGLLAEDKTYTYYDFDNPSVTYSANGASLMKDGIETALPAGQKVIILAYERQ